MDDFKINKSNFRVPRASNLVILKELVINLKENQKIDDLLNISKISKETHLGEYVQLILILGWMYKDNLSLLLTNEGKRVKKLLSDETSLTDNDKNIMKDAFFELELVKKFMCLVFSFNVLKKNMINTECLSKEQIISKYLVYRNVSRSVAERESRTIYNWLLDLDVLESLRILDYNKESFRVRYHIIGRNVTLSEFSKEIKVKVLNALSGKLSKLDWIEIPRVRYLFCIEKGISKNQFNKLFMTYIKENPNHFQLSTGSLLRKEVENEGIIINEKYYFYVRLIRSV